TINTLPSITISGLDPAYCYDALTATITATPTGNGGVWTGAINSSNEFEPSVHGAGNHTIYFEFTDGNGCVNNDSVITIVNPLPVVAVSALTDVCFDATNFIPSGATPAGGIWTGTGVNNNYFTAATAGAGTHFLTYSYTDANGCYENDSTAITVNALPVLTVTGLAIEYCANGIADTLVAIPVGGIFYGSGLAGNIFDPTNANTGLNSLLYMYTDANGCFNSHSVTTTVHTIPMIDLGSDNVVCEDANSTLDAGNSGSTFMWNTGATTQTIIIDTADFGAGTQTYSVVVTDANSCINNDYVDITYEVLPISSLTDTSSICGEDAEITIEAGTNIDNLYAWSTGGTTPSITLDASILGGTTGDVSVVITSPNGCITNASTYVYFRETPVVDLGADMAVCINHEVTLDAGAGYTSYLWNTGATTQTITLDSNTFNVGNNNYTVDVINTVNCSGFDVIKLVVDPCTGVKVPELANANINVYPNPTSGQFQIDVTGLENQDYNLDVYNSVGAVVFTDKVTYEGNDTQTWKLDFSTFAKGVYHIRLHSNGDIKVKRIIIQ
ncbi:MAG: T9SS type A sorting domain-containing protein, partial [Chlamydiia bacterium]|nr:T9SS type A sorting domain-containing protein [Chlamydiia bacterium]